MTTKRLAVLGIAALVACSNSSTPVDLSALDLSGRWTFLDSATALQVDTNVVYATVVARGTVDEKKIKSLRAKIDLSAAVTGDDVIERGAVVCRKTCE